MRLDNLDPIRSVLPVIFPTDNCIAVVGIMSAQLPNPVLDEPDKISELSEHNIDDLSKNASVRSSTTSCTG